MSPERRKKIQALYDSALKQDRTHRSSFLDQACEGDDELRGEVEGLLAQQSPDLTLTLIGIGTQLGPYRIESLIGAGGMGEVYRAVDTRLGRTVALKLVRPDMANRPDFRERLLREARAISALNHPHICTLYDFGEHDGLSHLVMEYVEGETLSARLRQGPLPIDLVLRYGIEIASALATAHARGIVHRDLKPANLIVTAFGIKVLDFGLAKSAAAAADAPLEASGAHRVVGTPAYMSPEQSRGERLDGRSDIFSLGCVLYQAATGIAPFRGASVMAILHEVATGMPVRPSSVRPELPQEFDLVLERALAKERDLRYASAADLEQALIALQSPLRVTAAQECEPEPLIGRERELQKLEGLLARATEGTGGMVLLMGEPGIGKTALAGSFLYSAVRRHPDLLVGRGACVEQYGAGEAYLPFLDALSGLLTGSGRERVIGVLRRQAPTWCLQFPAVFTGSSVDNLQLETIGANKERMLRELGDALGELASASPIVLLLEDLHWADTSSVDLLRHLGQRLRRGASGTRMLIMGTARPEELERENHPLRNCKRELEGHGVCEEIALRELPEQQVLHYLDLHFSPHSFPPDFARLIYRKTEGHPLFLTGALQFLTEHGEVVQSNGVWSLAKPVSGLDLQVPESVHNMLRKQLEVLPAEDRKTLQYASIEGEEFTSVVLAELLGVEELELEERLAAIEKVHRLIRTRGEEELPDGSLSNRYRFAHALYQNILYQDLLNKRRILLHRQAGEVLARRYGTETGQIAMALAAHFERGRDLPRAIQHLIHAADVAQSRYASETAEELCSRALLLSERLQPEERMQAEIALLNKRGRHRITTVHLPEAVSDFTAMLERARAAADPVHECMALIGLAWTSFGTHAIESNQANAHAALTIAERIGHKGLQALSKMFLGSSYNWAGDLERAKMWLDQSVGLAREAGDPTALLPAVFMRGATHYYQSEYEQAERCEKEAVALGSSSRDGFFLLFARFFLGLTLGNRGRISEALDTMNTAVELAGRNNNIGVLARIPNCIAWMHAELQDLETAARLNREAAEIARGYGIVEAEANSYVNLIGDYTCTGKSDQALAAIRNAKAAYEHDPWLQWRYLGIRLQANAAERCISVGDLDQAAAHVQTLLENAERTSARKYIAIAHKIRAEIAMKRGDDQTAEAELLTGLEELREFPAPLAGWKIHLALGRLRTRLGQSEAARDSYSQAASIVEHIASNVRDEQMRAAFLNRPIIREILQQATRAAES